MTEKEMLGKWCPHTENNRQKHFVEWPKCIGNACSQWRWSAQTQAIDGTWNVHATKTQVGFKSGERDGYCGLAGKP